MSDYTKTTNFAAKDALAPGNAAKVVKGAEIDTEFNNIATAVATKADKASPTFTGTPAAPTASSGTNSTQIATTAFVQTAITTASNTIAGNNTYSGNNTFTGTQTFRDNKFEITDNSDTTKKIALELSGITTATTRTLTVPDKSGTLALTSDISAAATLSAAVTATYSIAGTSMTINKTSHGYAVGDKLYLNFTSGTAVDGNFTVTTSSTNSFTVTYGSSITTSGDVTMYLYTTGTVDIASSDETLVGTNTLKAVTPKGLADKFADGFTGSNQSLTTSGYQKFPGGLIIQWGTNSDTNVAINFPIAFPNAGLSMTASVTPTSDQGADATVEIVSNSQFKLRCGTTTSNNNIHWIAIGY